MAARDLTRTSKFLALVLRHKPEEIGITLDAEGWVSIDVLLAAMAEHGHPLPLQTLAEIVRSDTKGRYSIEHGRIRANQGHSVEVDLKLEPMVPPEVLLHGTPEKNIRGISKEGLHKGSRHHVHLSEIPETATQVGERRGKASVLEIAAGRMHRDGHAFYRSQNGVWLTDHVPAKYITFPWLRPVT